MMFRSKIDCRSIVYLLALIMSPRVVVHGLASFKFDKKWGEKDLNSQLKDTNLQCDEVRSKFNDVESKFEGLRNDINSKFEGLRSDINCDEVNSKFDDAKFRGLKNDIISQFNDLYKEFGGLFKDVLVVSTKVNCMSFLLDLNGGSTENYNKSAESQEKRFGRQDDKISTQDDKDLGYLDDKVAVQVDKILAAQRAEVNALQKSVENLKRELARQRFWKAVRKLISDHLLKLSQLFKE